MAAALLPYKVLRFFHYLRELPLVWFLAGCLVARMGLSLLSTHSPQQRSRLFRRIAFAAGLFVLVTYLGLTLYSLRCFMIQQDEANILSIAAAGLHGLPIYNPPVSPDSSYSLMYGPVTFLIYRAALVLGGVNHFWIMRGFVVFANLALCGALYLLLRRFVSVFTAVALLAFPASMLLQHPDIAWSLRADIWIFLFATLAVLGSLLELELPAVLLVGVMGGLIVGLKITAGPAILLPLFFLYRKFGLRAVAISSLVATAVAFAPFALTDISFRNYIAWLMFTRTEGLSVTSAGMNLLFALFLLAPCLLMERFLRPFKSSFRRRLPEFSIILLCLFIAVLTSKNGSGPYYLWHAVPSLVLYLGLVSQDLQDIPAPEQSVPAYYIAVACALFACVNLPRACGYIKISRMTRQEHTAQQALNRYLALYQGQRRIQMGYGSVDGDYRTLLRYILVYKGEPYTIEGNTGRFETEMLPFPVNVLNQMKTCRDDIWLVPHAQRPFALWVFPGTLHDTFVQNYSVAQTDGIYDVWICNRSLAPGKPLAK